MNEKEKRIAEELGCIVMVLNPERREKLGEIMELAALLFKAHDEVTAEHAGEEANA